MHASIRNIDNLVGIIAFDLPLEPRKQFIPFTDFFCLLLCFLSAASRTFFAAVSFVFKSFSEFNIYIPTYRSLYSWNFQTILIIQDSKVTVDVPSYKIPHPLGFLFPSPVSLWLTDHIADHHILIGGIEYDYLELFRCNIQTRRWFNINETTITLLGCDTILSCNVVGHVEEQHPLSLGVSSQEE